MLLSSSVVIQNGLAGTVSEFGITAEKMDKSYDTLGNGCGKGNP
jgi:hypothetical protein